MKQKEQRKPDSDELRPDIGQQLLESAEKQRKAIADIGQQLIDGFAAVQSYMQGMEQRLTTQERQTKRVLHRQNLQQQEIDGLKKIVLDLAENRPIRRVNGSVAIRKEEAYERFEDCGIGKVSATRALRDAGMLRVDGSGKCTITIWHEGGCLRVLMVPEGDRR